MYDSYLLDSWDHTSSTNHLIHNLLCVVNNSLQKSKIKPLSIYDLHPFRENKKVGSGVHITPDNFGLLRSLVPVVMK